MTTIADLMSAFEDYVNTPAPVDRQGPLNADTAIARLEEDVAADYLHALTERTVNTLDPRLMTHAQRRRVYDLVGRYYEGRRRLSYQEIEAALQDLEAARDKSELAAAIKRHGLRDVNMMAWSAEQLQRVGAVLPLTGRLQRRRVYS